MKKYCLKEDVKLDKYTINYMLRSNPTPSLLQHSAIPPQTERIPYTRKTKKTANLLTAFVL